jgi:protein-S-isoprenylcysteine O-methyltransferase Ste14
MSAALALLLAVTWGVVFLFRTESLRGALPVYDRAERFWVVFTPAVLTVHFTIFGVNLTTGGSLAVWRGVVGTLVFLTGIGVWFGGRMAVGPVRVRRLPDEPPLRFRRDGLFGTVRNPLACGMLIAALAPLIIQPTAILVVTFLAGATGLVVRVFQEERRMLTQLGPVYEAYARDVKRLIPFVW